MQYSLKAIKYREKIKGKMKAIKLERHTVILLKFMEKEEKHRKHKFTGHEGWKTCILTHEPQRPRVGVTCNTKNADCFAV